MIAVADECSENAPLSTDVLFADFRWALADVMPIRRHVREALPAVGALRHRFADHLISSSLSDPPVEQFIPKSSDAILPMAHFHDFRCYTILLECRNDCFVYFRRRCRCCGVLIRITSGQAAYKALEQFLKTIRLIEKHCMSRVFDFFEMC